MRSSSRYLRAEASANLKHGQPATFHDNSEYSCRKRTRTANRRPQNMVLYNRITVYRILNGMHIDLVGIEVEPTASN